MVNIYIRAIHHTLQIYIENYGGEWHGLCAVGYSWKGILSNVAKVQVASIKTSVTGLGMCELHIVS